MGQHRLFYLVQRIGPFELGLGNKASPQKNGKPSIKENIMAQNTFQIAAVQASPVFMDREATVEKTCRLIAEAAGNGARLVVFPETFIPAYPDWIWHIPAGQIALNQKLYGALLDQAVSIPGATTDRLCRAARDAGVYVSIGVNERNDNASGGSLFNTNVLIDREGNLLGRHQKLVPTVSERTIWAYGDPGTLDVYDTEIGKIGGLICHENYMPLARYSLYGRGIELSIRRQLTMTAGPGNPPSGISAKKGVCMWRAAAWFFARTTFFPAIHKWSPIIKRPVNG
jgi:hypothetical protein